MVKVPENAKEQLLAAAKKLFSRQGLAGTTVRELADEAGVNLSLVSYYFDGKEGLYRACLEQFGRARLEAGEKVLQIPKSREELRIRVEMFVEGIIGAHFQEPELAAMVHKECDSEVPVIEDIFRNTFLQMFERLNRFLEGAKKNGLLREDVEPFFASIHLISLLIHPCRMERNMKKFHGVSLADGIFREKFKSHLVSVFLGGVAKEGV